MKKILSVLLSVIVLFSAFTCVPFYAMAATQGVLEDIENPLYSGEEIKLPDMKLKSNAWMKDTALQLRDYMVSRSSENFEYTMPSGYISADALADEIVDLVLYACSQELSVGTTDGDYIRYQFSALDNLYYSYNSQKGGYDISFKMIMRTTAKEEEIVDNTVNSILSSVNMNSISDYELLRFFHDYVLDVCEYNYIDMDDKYNYTCYGAFNKGSAVCQGYALAFYRLCKEAGFDCRIIASDPDMGCHAWNLVYLGDAYYYVDCTWDDEYENKYQFFLVNYKDLQAEDTRYHEHRLYSAMYNNDTYFNNVYRPNISGKNWSTSEKSIANCVINVDTANIYNSTVLYNGSLLSAGADYTVTSTDDCFIAVNGAGEFAGTKSKRINSISVTSPVLEYYEAGFNGTAKEPKVYIGGLTENVDYYACYSDNTEAGTANVSVIGIGKYAGHKNLSFEIKSADINLFNIQLSYTSTVYSGYEQMPNVTVDGLRQGIDYIVECSPIKDVGTGYIYIKGINNCYSTAVRTYEIYKRNIGECNISLSTASYVYNGNAKYPKVYVQGLTEGMDYTVSYSNNVNPGKAAVTITGTNFYDGSVTVNFYILPKKVSVKTATDTSSVSLNASRQNGVSGYIIERYSGNTWKRIATVKGTSLSYKNKGLDSGKSYKYRVCAYVIVDGIMYTGEENTVTAKTTGPAKATLSSLNAGKKSITVNWKKQSCSGYEIQYSTSSNFKNAKKVKVSSKTKSKKISSLKKKKKYYVRVRAYNTVKGKKVYGTWSAKKSVKTK